MMKFQGENASKDHKEFEVSKFGREVQEGGPEASFTLGILEMWTVFESRGSIRTGLLLEHRSSWGAKHADFVSADLPACCLT